MIAAQFLPRRRWRRSRLRPLVLCTLIHQGPGDRSALCRPARRPEPDPALVIEPHHMPPIALRDDRDLLEPVHCRSPVSCSHPTPSLTLPCLPLRSIATGGSASGPGSPPSCGPTTPPPSPCAPAASPPHPRAPSGARGTATS